MSTREAISRSESLGIIALSNGFDENGQEIVYTTREACEYLKISRPTYLKYIAEGRIKAIKVGRGWRTLKTELDRFLRGD